MNNCGSTPASTASIINTYSGDTFVGRVNITDYSYAQSDANGKTTEAYHIAFPTQDTGINYEFKHSSTDPIYSHFKWNYEYADEGHKSLRNHMVSKYYEETDDIMELYPQAFGYNQSYSYLQSIETYFSTPFNYEYCNECIESYPYRIYYSEQGDPELQRDNYRLIRPNNYKNIDNTTGIITDLFTNFDQLYALTENSIYFLPTRPQTLSTDSGAIYLGTGEVLSLPAKQLKTTDFAFGGSTYFKSRVNTEYGTFYVDDTTGRPFLLDNQLNDVSLKGLRNFWQEQGPIQLNKQFLNLTDSEYSIGSTLSDYGVGYISTYDPRYKRIIVHKRDFKVLPQ